MKLIKRSFLLITVLLLVTTCKKYPKDIPQFVKDKIKFCDKKKNDCHGLIIDEYSFNGNLYYRFHVPYPIPTQNEYFNNQGSSVCIDAYELSYPSCGYFSSGGLILTRRIWQEN